MSSVAIYRPPLTDAQRRLVVDHLDAADFAASLTARWTLPRADRVSAGQLGLCLAAQTWRGERLDGPFDRYARRKAVWEIRAEIRAELRRRSRHDPWDAAEHDRPDPDAGDAGGGVECRDEAAPFVAAIGNFPATQSTTLRMRLFDGADREAVAASLECSLRMVDTHWRRGIRKLKKLAGAS